MSSRFYTIWLKQEAYIAVLEETIRKLPCETGGVLLGYWGSSLDVVITAVVGPGSLAIHKQASFIPDNDYHSREIKSHYEKTGRTETYLGDWHTHPEAKANLSTQDRKTLSTIANYRNARLDKPIMMILGTRPFELTVWVHVREPGIFSNQVHLYTGRIVLF
ncbi:hypothetical protein GCM10023189_33030 [Nibrella saemangeumensis]|uniref:MPN domain-containing protein n=1 Tax=Nibrella saemangeumensis TaxID=1084526 RepID=A0ABP8N3J2_9BACT